MSMEQIREEESCAVGRNGIHFHCDVCGTCPGVPDTYPPGEVLAASGFWSIHMTRRSDAKAIDSAPVFTVCGACAARVLFIFGKSLVDAVQQDRPTTDRERKILKAIKDAGQEAHP